MTKGSGGKSNPPPTNPMPTLTPDQYAALRTSITERGIICPVIKDQTGYVLDGHNRLAIAADLGIAAPEVVWECDPGQRDILRVELNGARRQINEKQWKPLVDHLRSKIDDQGVRLYSDRSIAVAVGVSNKTVSLYKDPAVTGVTAGKSTKGRDGKTYPTGGTWTARSRALHLIEQASDGLTAPELEADEIMRGYKRVNNVPGGLRDQGLIIDSGKKRGGAIVWVKAPPRQPTQHSSDRKVDKLLSDLKDPQIREDLRDRMADEKGMRQAEAILRAAEKEVEATEAAEAQRQADAEKERKQMVEAARRHVSTTIKTWDTLIEEVKGSWIILSSYSQILDDFPAPHPSFIRLLDTELAHLRGQLDWFDMRLHPHGKPTVVRKGTGPIIDV